MTTERIDIVVREDGSRVVRRNLDDVGDAADGAADALDTLKGVMAALVTGAVLSKLAEYTGIWTDLTARVSRFAGTAANTGATMERIMSIAQRTYAPLESTAEIYLENAFALQQLGKTQQQTLDYTEAMTNALVVSGAKGQRAETVIRALSKAMLEGSLRGDNWQSVLQQGGRITELLTAQTGKSLSELDRMARDGKLSMDVVFDALVNNLSKLQEEADEMPATVGDAFIRLRNRVIQVIGEMDEKLGASQGFVKLIDAINANLETIVPLLAGVAAAVVTAFAPGIIMAFAGQVKGLWVLMAAHPFVAITAAIAGVLTALYLLRDELSLGIDETTTFGDLMRSVWEEVGPLLATVAETARNVFGFIGETLLESTRLWLGITGDYVRKDEAMWLSVVRVVLQVFDTIGAAIRGTFVAAGRSIGIFVAAAIESFLGLGDVINKVMSGDFQDAWDTAKANAAKGVDAWKEIGSQWGTAYGEAFRAQADSGLEAWLDGRIERAKQIGLERSQAEAATLDAPSPFTPGSPVDADAAKKAAREMDRLRNSLRSLLDSIYPVDAAKRALSEAQDTLTRSVAAGLISVAEARQAYDDLRESMADQLDPLAALNRELDESIELLRMSSGQREIEAELLRMTEQMRRSGVKLTQEETAALRAKLVVEQELARISQARDSMWQNSGAGQLEEFRVNVEAMKQLLADAQSGFGAGDVAGALQQMLPWANLDGTKEQMDAYVQQHADMYEQIRLLEEQSLINAQTANQLRLQADQQMLERRLQYTREFFGALAQLSTSENRKLAQIGKAAAIVQATIDGVLAVQKTMAETPYPYNIPLAAAQAAVAAANVAQIASTGFRTGGTMTVGGSGGSDSQLVAFRATPGEKVQVNTPAQARALEKGGQPTEVSVPVTVVNVRDPDEVPNALRDHPGSKGAIINMLAEDPGSFRQALNLNS